LSTAAISTHAGRTGVSPNPAGVDPLMLQCFPPEYDRSLENLGIALDRYRDGAVGS
jgi:hypothetical protein